MAALTSETERSEYQSKLDENQRKYSKLLSELLPEERARPSILTPTATKALGCLMAGAQCIVASPGDSEIVLSAIEKAV